MFTQTVEVTAKAGKARELASTINDKVLPILKKQARFVDEDSSGIGYRTQSDLGIEL